MAISIPTTFLSADQLMFAEGQPVSSKHATALRNAHNHIVGRGSQMCCLTWPARTYTVGDDLTPYAYDFTAGTFWKLVVPPTRVPKKPGMTVAEFKLNLFQFDGGIKFQLNTLASPFRRAPPAGWPGTLDLPVLVNSEVLNQTFTDVPVSPGAFDVIELWAVSTAVGSDATSFLGGSPATANIQQAFGGGIIYCYLEGANLNWDPTNYINRKGDFATNRYVASIFDPSGNPAGVFRIKSVVNGPTRGAGGFVSRGLWLETEERQFSTTDILGPDLVEQINISGAAGAPYTVTIARGASFSMTCLAGRTRDRTR